jgi:hypothetical protein
MKDFLEECFHLGSGSSIIRRSAIIRPTTVKKNPVDQPHIKIPVKASTPPTSRHFSGKTRSPYPTVGVGHATEIQGRLKIGHGPSPAVEKSPDGDFDQVK